MSTGGFVSRCRLHMPVLTWIVKLTESKAKPSPYACWDHPATLR